MTGPEHPVGITSLLEACELRPEEVSAAGMTVEELHRIYSDHVQQFASLQSTGEAILNRLRTIREVHSVRSRVKNPTRLIRKIVRKKIKDPQRVITFENYHRDITDLVGIRALHLFKEDWEAIHEFITGQWEVAEVPIAYVREGDSDEWIRGFKERGCDVELHPRYYRSVHYLIPTALTRRPTTVEIQVRTLMEEAWSEIDHRINYPEPTSWQEVRRFLVLFNRLAGMADEMGSYVADLERWYERKEREQRTRNADLDRLIESLDLTPEKRRAFDRGVSDMVQKSATRESAVSPEIGPIADALRTATYMTDHVGHASFADLIGGLTITRTCTHCQKSFQASGRSAYIEPAFCEECASATPNP